MTWLRYLAGLGRLRCVRCGCVCVCVCVGGEGEGAQVAEDAMMVCARAGCWNLDGKQGSRWYVREAYR